MSRKFEYVNRILSTGYEMKHPDFNLPQRKTKKSAGYDFEAAEDTIIPSYKRGMAPTLVKTGVKAYMQDDEVLLLYNRSSNPKKKGLVIPNSVGVIDSDYYGNPDNDGEIMFAFYNLGDTDITIHKGEAIGQGVFTKFLITDDDNAQGTRVGGFGSTDNPNNNNTSKAACQALADQLAEQITECISKSNIRNMEKLGIGGMSL